MVFVSALPQLLERLHRESNLSDQSSVRVSKQGEDKNLLTDEGDTSVSPHV
jgi:hypothetical protein